VVQESESAVTPALEWLVEGNSQLRESHEALRADIEGFGTSLERLKIQDFRPRPRNWKKWTSAWSTELEGSPRNFLECETGRHSLWELIAC
jgi:hypothetical protein